MNSEDEQIVIQTCNFLLNRVEELQNQCQLLNDSNRQLKEICIEQQKAIEVLGDSLKEVIVNVNEEFSEQKRMIFVHGRNKRFELNDPRYLGEEYFYPKIVEGEKAIEQIMEFGKSMARFGDGEFSIIVNKERQKFQRLDEKLSTRLKEVLYSKDERLIIGIADNYGDLRKYDFSGANNIRVYMSRETRESHELLLEKDRIYYDAYVTRPYVMYEDKYTDAPCKRFESLKGIWKGRNVVIVEGAQTRFGAGNDLLLGALSVRRILAPATSSFDRYDDILKASLENAKKGDLYLLAIGPCAGVLAYDLCINGIQAVDIGHTDLEYEWFLAGEGRRVRVPYKYNNELECGDEVEEYNDPVYLGQIIFSCAD